MRKIAIIPVKKKSDRVQNKNFRQFADGLSLLELKLRQVIDSGAFDAVYVSSNSDDAAEASRRAGVVHLERDEHFCSNDVCWSDVIHHVVSTVPEPDDVLVSWCHTTSPLFARYKDALDKVESLLAEKSEFDGLVAVNPFSEFLLTEKSRPFNYNWGVWHDYSQHMEKLYRVTGALFVASRAEMLRNRYVISRRPFLFPTSAVEGLDVDTDFDFALAAKIYSDKELQSKLGA